MNVDDKEGEEGEGGENENNEDKGGKGRRGRKGIWPKVKVKESPSIEGSEKSK